MTPSFSQNGSTMIASATVTNATDPQTAVEIVIPNWNTGTSSSIQVRFDGVPANAADYRITSYGVKARVGSTVSNVEISYSFTPVVTDIPNQTIAEGASFATLNLDDYVSDVDNTDAQLTWSYSGNTTLIVNIVDRVATISSPLRTGTGPRPSPSEPPIRAVCGMRMPQRLR